MPVTALPVTTTFLTSGMTDLLKTSPPTTIRIVPAFSPESDAARWALIQNYIQKDFDTHHVEVLNQHTKQYQPNYAVHALLAYYKIDACETVVRERYELESRMLDAVSKGNVEIGEGNWKEFLGKGQRFVIFMLFLS